MRNPLQDQLLKAGLVKKSKVAQVVREQSRQRQGKALAPAEDKVDTQRLQAERAERDRALAMQRNEEAHRHELAAQVRQIVDAHKIKREGEIDYRFSDAGTIRSVLVDKSARTMLAAGSLVIVRHGAGYELVPRGAADRIAARAASLIVVDHAHRAGETDQPDEDEFYSRFQVPDDLVW